MVPELTDQQIEQVVDAVCANLPAPSRV
jgi:hypothetical protein